MTARRLGLLNLTLLLAVGCLALLAFNPRIVHAAQLSISTDRSQYAPGDNITVCYTVPSTGNVVITDLPPDGSSTVILSGFDDGTGGCISGTITPPFGRECIRIDFSGGAGRGSQQTCFQVVSSAPPPPPPPVQASRPSTTWAGITLPVPFVSQYPSGWSRTQDCGAAAVAQVAYYYAGSSTAFGSDLDVITTIRNATSKSGQDVDLWFSDLETVIPALGLHYNEILGSWSVAARLRVMNDSIGTGRPVIALINGNDLGRNYRGNPNHWVVVTGFSGDGQTIYLNDPDYRTAAMLRGVGAGTSWINGGSISLPITAFSRALGDAVDDSGISGLVVVP